MSDEDHLRSFEFHSIVSSVLDLLINSAKQLVLCVLTDVEFLAKVLYDFFWVLTLKDAEQLNIFAIIELHFENTNWLLLRLIHYIVQCWSWRVLDMLRASSCKALSWYSGRILEVAASIPSLACLSCRVKLISKIIPRCALGPGMGCGSFTHWLCLSRWLLAPRLIPS